MVLLCFPNNDLFAFFWQFQSLMLVLLVRIIFLCFELFREVEIKSVHVCFALDVVSR